MEFLGEGASASVFGDGQYAYKIPYDEGSLVMEIACQSQLRHPNILPLLGFKELEAPASQDPMRMTERGRKLSLVYPRIRTMPASQLTPGQLREVVGDVLDALVFVHEQGLVHGDVKLDNVLVDGSNVRPRGVLGDFNSAVPWGTEVDYRGDPDFETPESHARSSAGTLLATNYGADIWTLGASVLALLLGKNLLSPDKYHNELLEMSRSSPSALSPSLQGAARFERLSEMAFESYEEMDRQMKERAANFPHHLEGVLAGIAWPNGFEFLARMLVVDPASRTTAREILVQHFRLPTSGTYLVATRGPRPMSVLPDIRDKLERARFPEIKGYRALAYLASTWSSSPLTAQQADLLVHVGYFLSSQVTGQQVYLDLFCNKMGLDSVMFLAYLRVVTLALGGHFL